MPHIEGSAKTTVEISDALLRRVVGDAARSSLQGPRRVIAVATNVLVYAHREASPFHDTAFQRVAQLAEGPAIWAIPWPCMHEFLAIVTYPRIYAPPTPLGRALDQVDAWLEMACASYGRRIGTLAVSRGLRW
jgi:hypothetical protein